MKRKFLSILTAIAVAASLSACQPSSSTELIDSVTTVVEEVAEPIEMKTIEPPEDGWTVEQLNEVIYINGINHDYPIIMHDLGDDFTADDNLVLYKNELAFGGSINDKGIYNSLMFSTAWNQSEIPNNMLININGITLGSDLQEISLKLGDTELITKSELTRIIYELENLTLIFIVNEEMKISIITLSWEE